MQPKLNWLLLIALLLPATPHAAKNLELLKEENLTAFKQAYQHYNMAFDTCERLERLNPPVTTADINFINRQQAAVLINNEVISRLSACLLPYENAVIRKHIEAISNLRVKKILAHEEEALVQTLDIYYGLENPTTKAITEKYKLLPESLRVRFSNAVKGKSLSFKWLDLVDSLPE